MAVPEPFVAETLVIQSGMSERIQGQLALVVMVTLPPAAENWRGLADGVYVQDAVVVFELKRIS